MNKPMFSVNKKLWSFNFGCMIAGSFVWLVSVGAQMPVPEVLHDHVIFVHQYYEGLVTAVFAVVTTIAMLLVMHRGFRICVSEHPFWVLVPSLFFVVLTAISAFELLSMILFAAVPTMIMLACVAISLRVTRRKLKNRISLEN
ncbi:hypothetical protein [Thalassotalea fusca]